MRIILVGGVLLWGVDSGSALAGCTAVIPAAPVALRAVLCSYFEISKSHLGFSSKHENFLSTPMIQRYVSDTLLAHTHKKKRTRKKTELPFLIHSCIRKASFGSLIGLKIVLR